MSVKYSSSQVNKKEKKQVISQRYITIENIIWCRTIKEITFEMFY
jgi:hypothetical protein